MTSVAIIETSHIALHIWDEFTQAYCNWTFTLVLILTLKMYLKKLMKYSKPLKWNISF